MEFEYKGTKFRLQGLLPAETIELKQISGEELMKMHKGNDLCATVMIAPVQDNEKMQE